MKLSSLWKSPELNPRDLKAKSIPFLNPINIYGRVFHLSWLSFCVCFLSWFAFPPLMKNTIAKDLHMTAVDIANNNICGLSATLLARLIIGPLCDKYGPRLVMTGVLISGAIPTAFVPLVTNIPGVHAIRFFIGILGGSFVPCQYFTTIFFDKNIVGTANAFAGGWGNAGGGIAFFVMPALVADLAGDGYNFHKSWTYAFTVGPFIILMFVAALVFFLGQDCPEGAWSKRGDILGIGMDNTLVNVVSVVSQVDEKTGKLTNTFSAGKDADTVNVNAHVIPIDDLINKEEIIESPSFFESIKVGCHYRTMVVALPYLTTFGGELAVESILSTLYLKHNKSFTQQKAGDWGSMMGLLNVVTRPLGGIISDILYRYFKTTKAKKFWCLFCGFIQGVFLLWIGLVPSISISGLIASLGIMSVFMEMGNGANYATVYFINKKHPGIVSGVTGAFGNLGGILFSLVFRYNVNKGVTDYFKSLYIIGAVVMGVNALCSFIPIREEVPEIDSSHNENDSDATV